MESIHSLERYLRIAEDYVLESSSDSLEAQVVWDSGRIIMRIPGIAIGSANLRCYAALFFKTAPAQLARAIVLTNRLRDGVAAFQYVKTDGSTRIAYGTLNMEIIHRRYVNPAASSTPVRRKRKNYAKDGIFVYFDLEKLGWREFHISPGFQLIDSYIL